MKSHIAASDFLGAVVPRQVMSRDGRAMNEGIQAPPQRSGTTPTRGVALRERARYLMALWSS
jgi:hypothetical protein